MNIPPFVFILFAVLFLVGIRQIRPRKMSIYQLFLLPSIFIIISIYNCFNIFKTFYFSDLFSIIVGISIGVLLGYIHVKSWNTTVNRASRTISIPGDYLMLLVFLLFFVFEFFVHGSIHAKPLIEESFFFQTIVVLVYAFFCGMSLGRNITLGYVVLTGESPHQPEPSRKDT